MIVTGVAIATYGVALSLTAWRSGWPKSDVLFGAVQIGIGALFVVTNSPLAGGVRYALVAIIAVALVVTGMAMRRALRDARGQGSDRQRVFPTIPDRPREQVEAELAELREERRSTGRGGH